MHNTNFVHSGYWPYDYRHGNPGKPLTFVLVHGSWADSSFWQPVGAELTARGHIVYAPEYPGHGGDPNTH